MTELESRTICIDLDQTLCVHDGDYAKAAPTSGAREALTSLHNEGWTIVLHTARHFNYWKLTVEWLGKHGLVYDQIVFGKPPARFYVDDRAIAFNGNWKQVCEAIWTKGIE